MHAESVFETREIQALMPRSTKETATKPAPPDASPEDARWLAVQTRDSQQDGRFVYAVKTTGVFCRPGCASRQPRRENVSFFDTTEAARAAGFRACQRCQPTRAQALSASAELLREACAALSAEETLSVRDLAARLGLSESYLHRSFQRELGVTPQQYRRRVQAEKARAALPGASSVTASIFEAGYSSGSRFYDNLGKELGMRALSAARGAPGERIEYTCAPCSLGCVLLAWTGRGVCAVLFGENPEALANELKQRFPRATLCGVTRADWLGELVRAVEHAAPASLPLDLRGTAFQARVWQALRHIPRGETRTYSQLAASIGAPNAARAVAAACAANPIACLIPCHRVVRSDGDISGYRWGVARKKALLQREAEAQ